MKLNLLTAAAIALFSLSACAPSTTTDSVPVKTIETAPSAKAVSAGTFSGRSDHITTGTASLVKTAGGYQIVLSDDFELDGAPDPVVVVGNNETYAAANKLGALKNRTGAQTYNLPSNISPGQFSQVYIWCEKFSVPLGVATLGAASTGS